MSTAIASPYKPLIKPLIWFLFLVSMTAATTAGIFAIQALLGSIMIEDAPPHSFRLMTWNIGKLYLQWDSRAADNDLSHVAAVIHSVNPHIVALQELRDPRQLGRLVAQLGPGWRGKMPEDQYDRRAALLVRLPADFVELSTSTGRTAQAATFHLPDREHAVVVSLHLDAFDAKRRLLQAEEIVAGADRLEHKNLFLAGDFNLDPAVTAQGSQDHDLYRFLISKLVDAGKYGGATSLISRRLDYIFYKCPGVQQARARVLHDQRINIMDHDPVVVEFVFAPKTTSWRSRAPAAHGAGSS